jgi:hypothetical protein
MNNTLQIGQFYKLPSGELVQFFQWKNIFNTDKVVFDFRQASDCLIRLLEDQVESLELVTDSEAIAEWNERKNAFFKSKGDFLKSNPQLNHE